MGWCGRATLAPTTLKPTASIAGAACRWFASLADVPDITLISLQKGIPAQQARATPEGMRLFDIMDEMHDFADTAALVETLDLVITVDTSAAHLAGAMGKPAWILSRFDGCWRWLEERDDSPWYPTARLFRQTRPDNWPEVVERIQKDLAWFSATLKGGSPVNAEDPR